MSENWLQRGELLLGEEKQGVLANSHLLVVGLGGVGSWAAEMLCRAGVGAFTLVDADVVDVTNINRQMPALASTVGHPKCDVVAERLRAINPNVQLVVKQQFVTPENVAQLLDEHHYDFIVDAIDTLDPKCALIRACWERDLKIISSMGAGAKCHPKIPAGPPPYCGRTAPLRRHPDAPPDGSVPLVSACHPSR